ncbi:MAG: hypothetical protein C9356_09185 [Oleiphilus sp.]|nr:MAG: hypothetical protein C9356_09185 [Oleiphilus sp.]
MRSFTISPEEVLMWRGLKYRVTRILDLEHVLAVNLHTGELDKIRTDELQPEFSSSGLDVCNDLSEVCPEDWEAAGSKYETIKPLINLGDQRTANDVQKIAKASGKSVATLYRWIQDYEGSEKLSSLIRRTRVDEGKSRLTKEQDKLIAHCIETYYLTMERPSVRSAYAELLDLCDQSNIKACSLTTFDRRVQKIAPREIAKRRLGPKAARENYEEATDSFPSGRYPLDAVQIDHTRPNVILVDDEFGKPIGRPWVTFAIDIYSRVIPGFLLSLEAPSATSVALCLTHSVARKEKWLRNKDIDTNWPVWGKMRALYADNGPDFKSKALDVACNEHTISLNWRPLGKPEFGGHVERLMRTVKTDLSNLKGTTFSNPIDRGDYDSEGRAIFTFADFEKWLTVYITKYYHNRPHSALGTSPMKKFEQGIFYGDDMPPTGLPAVLEDEHRFYLDFLPFARRTVQRYGIELDNISYFHPSIARWIGVKSNSDDGKFTVKYERGQIAHVYFFDPELKDYIEIPRVRRDAPPMTRFELKQVQAALRRRGERDIDEQKLIDSQRELKSIASNAEKQTKKIRRDRQREKIARDETKHLLKEEPSPIITQATPDSIDWDNADGFAEIDLDSE